MRLGVEKTDRPSVGLAPIAMESIAGLRECEEAEEGCALRTRDASIALLTESETVSGIGPPDLCTVNKVSTTLPPFPFLRAPGVSLPPALESHNLSDDLHPTPLFGGDAVRAL